MTWHAPVELTSEECRTAGENNVLIECASKIHVRPLNGARQYLVNALAFFADEFRIEENLRCAMTARSKLEWRSRSTEQNASFAHLNRRSIGQGELRLVTGIGIFFLRYGCEETRSLLDAFDDFELGRRFERVTLFAQQQLEVARDITTSNIVSKDTMRHSESYNEMTQRYANNRLIEI